MADSEVESVSVGGCTPGDVGTRYRRIRRTDACYTRCTWLVNSKASDNFHII